MRFFRWLSDLLFGRYRRIEDKLDLILALQVNTMSDLEDLVTALDAETNAVAAKLDKLSADLAAALADGSAPKPETLAALSAISDRLKALGADPAAPIPAPTPDPAPAPTPDPAPPADPVV